MPSVVSDERPPDMKTGLDTGLEIAGPSLPLPLASGNGRDVKATFTRNSLLSVGRLFISTIVALILPAYLAKRLPVTTYSAWILILQMSAYVSYLDFGVQTGIAKYVAEYEARQDTDGASMRASAGFAIMLVTSLLGVGLTFLLAWRVPHLFHQMPAALFHDVRLSLIFVGIALSFSLLCSIFSSIFLGLQRYGVPMALALVNRFLFTGAVLTAVFFHSRLALMGASVAGIHIVTGLASVAAWRTLASNIRIRLRGLDFTVFKQMLSYCSTLAIWTAGMLCVSGLDVTIVGHYDYGQTAFYNTATLPTNFMLSIMGAAIGPLMPAASALSVHRSAGQMGQTLARVTRYSTILLVLSAVPLLVGGYLALRVWVGPVYALHAVGYIRILVLANVIRNLCLPYASMLVATESQKVAIAGASAEAIVNLSSSIYLARHLGAMGVAYGTLLGAFVSVGMHFAVSMHYTQTNFAISRLRLLLSGILRPLAIMLPSLLLLPFWWMAAAPRLTVSLWLVWTVATLLLAWYFGLGVSEREQLLMLASRKLRPGARYNQFYRPSQPK